MKICYLCPDLGIPLSGSKGGSSHVRGFVRALKLLGHKALIVAGNAGGERALLDVPVVPVKRPGFWEEIPAGPNPRLARALRHLWNNAAVEQTLQTVFGNFRPDLVYERYSPFAVAGGALAAREGIQHILEVNAPLAAEGKRYRRQALQEAAEFLERTAFHSTSLITVVSHQLKRFLISQGVSASKIVAVKNGVDTDLFTPRGSYRTPLLPRKRCCRICRKLEALAWCGLPGRRLH